MTYLDFKREASTSSTSWERADPAAALVERSGVDEYVVMLRDGETPHTVSYATERGARVGYCDCKGFEYRDRDDSPCAHLCVLRKAEFVGADDVNGRPVEAADTAELVEAGATEPDPELRADGGRDLGETPAAGADGRTFGRPEYRR